MPSLFELCALVALLLFFGAGAYICSLETRIIALGETLEVANATNPHHDNLKTLLGEHEALQGAYKTSQDTIRGLRATNAARNIKVTNLEDLHAASNTDHERAAMQQIIAELRQQLAATKSKPKNLQTVCKDRNDHIRSLVAAADLTHVEMVRLDNIVSAQASTIWQRDVVVGQFNHVKELIHQLVAAGGLQMVVTVLFVGLLALFGGIDLAELGIDHLKFETYFEYARAQADGLLCPLLPQGGFRLNGLQYPLSGLRVVGTRIVEPATTFCASFFSGPVSSAPLPSAHLSSAPVSSAPVSSAPLPPPQVAAPVAAPGLPFYGAGADNSAWPPLPSPSESGLTTPPNSPSRALAPATTTAPLPPASVTATPAAPTLLVTPAAPAGPAQNETKTTAFQVSKAPGSFGPRGTTAKWSGGVQSSGVTKSSDSTTRRS